MAKDTKQKVEKIIGAVVNFKNKTQKIMDNAKSAFDKAIAKDKETKIQKVRGKIKSMK